MTGNSDEIAHLYMRALYGLMRKAGRSSAAPLKPPTSPISIMIVYALRSSALLISDSTIDILKSDVSDLLGLSSLETFSIDRKLKGSA